jgi:hypothetical protein
MNLKRKPAWLLCCVASFCMLFTLACNDDKTIPLSSGLADPAQLGQRLQATKTAALDSTASKIVNTFGTTNLWLGKFDNMESRVLMRFAKLSLPDTVTVVAGTLKLHGNLVQGKGADFDATFHQVIATTAWDSGKVTWENGNFPVEFNPAPMNTQRVSAVKSDSIVFQLDPAVVSSWRTVEGRQQGLVIQAPGAMFMKAFGSHFSTPKPPVLELITLKRGSTKNDTTRLSPSVSIYLFQRQAALRQGPLYIGLGEQHQSTLFFDVSAIPKNATISRALITLEVDTLNSAFYPDRLDLQLAYVGPVQIENYNFNPLRFEPFGSYQDTLRTAELDTVGTASKQVTFAATSAVQQWVSEAKNNFGVILLPVSFSARDLARAAFYSRETDAARAPKLQIEYTLPPQ